jgi:hypothetical protein
VNKIPTLFARDPEDRAHVLPDQVTPSCEWVLAGEGIATRKYDGTCVMLDMDGDWWARREVTPGKTPPAGWVEVTVDDVIGKRIGWEPVSQSPFAKFHAEAVERRPDATPGTYELVGPKINGNPERADWPELIRHAMAERVPEYLDDLDPVALVRFVAEQGNWEGIVWHHPDGRMAKLKGRDLKTRPHPLHQP